MENSHLCSQRSLARVWLRFYIEKHIRILRSSTAHQPIAILQGTASHEIIEKVAVLQTAAHSEFLPP